MYKKNIKHIFERILLFFRVCLLVLRCCNYKQKLHSYSFNCNLVMQRIILKYRKLHIWFPSKKRKKNPRRCEPCHRCNGKWERIGRTDVKSERKKRLLCCYESKNWAANCSRNQNYGNILGFSWRNKFLGPDGDTGPCCSRCDCEGRTYDVSMRRWSWKKERKVVIRWIWILKLAQYMLWNTKYVKSIIDLKANLIFFTKGHKCQK